MTVVIDTFAALARKDVVVDAVSDDYPTPVLDGRTKTLVQYARHTRMQPRPVRPAGHSLGGNLRRLVWSSCRIFRLVRHRTVQDIKDLSRWMEETLNVQLSTAAERR